MARTRTRPAASPDRPTPDRTPDRTKETRQGVLTAVGAAEAKKADDITLLALDPASGSFTDYFVICTGSNPRQIQAISDEVEQQLRTAGIRPVNVEGYQQAEWVLLDYVDFVVHVFSESARKYYDLERLWKSATKIEPSELSATRKPARASAQRSSSRSAKSLSRPAAKPRKRTPPTTRKRH